MLGGRDRASSGRTACRRATGAAWRTAASSTVPITTARRRNRRKYAPHAAKNAERPQRAGLARAGREFPRTETPTADVAGNDGRDGRIERLGVEEAAERGERAAEPEDFVRERARHRATPASETRRPRWGSTSTPNAPLRGSIRDDARARPGARCRAAAPSGTSRDRIPSVRTGAPSARRQPSRNAPTTDARGRAARPAASSEEGIGHEHRLEPRHPAQRPPAGGLRGARLRGPRVVRVVQIERQHPRPGRPRPSGHARCDGT